MAAHMIQRKHCPIWLSARVFKAVTWRQARQFQSFYSGSGGDCVFDAARGAPGGGQLMAEIRVPQPARPFGVTAISILLAVSAVALLVLTLLHHVGALAGLLRLVAVLTFVLIAIGLWKVHNNARVFLFFLLVSDVLGCLMALFLYALRQSHYRLAVFLVIQICIVAAFVWYLQSPGV